MKGDRGSEKVAKWLGVCAMEGLSLKMRIWLRGVSLVVPVCKQGLVQEHKPTLAVRQGISKP